MDKKFRDLLTRFVNGNCTPEERDRIHQWYEKIADHELELDAEERRLIGTRMLANIQKEPVAYRRSQSGQRHLLPAALWRVAAAVVVIALFSLWFFGGRNFFVGRPASQIASTSSDIVYENKTNKASLHLLPDGSTVRLEPFSTLRFRKDFSIGDREVYLIGKGFFDIVKDSSKPFYVYSGKIATRVLGTSFFVDAPAGAVKVGVKVVTGKVSVFPVDHGKALQPSDDTKNSTANGVVLSPNQKVDYYIEGGHWVTGLVEDPVPVKAIDVETLSFVFSNTPIRQVLEDINERFGIEVVTENERISQCTFTGDVSKMPLYDMLDVISNSIGSTYEVKGTRILVSGKGCDGASPEKN